VLFSIIFQAAKCLHCRKESDFVIVFLLLAFVLLCNFRVIFAIFRSLRCD